MAPAADKLRYYLLFCFVDNYRIQGCFKRQVPIFRQMHQTHQTLLQQTCTSLCLDPFTFHIYKQGPDVILLMPKEKKVLVRIIFTWNKISFQVIVLHVIIKCNIFTKINACFDMYLFLLGAAHGNRLHSRSRISCHYFSWSRYNSMFMKLPCP